MDQAGSAAPGTHLETSPHQTGQGGIHICPSYPEPVPTSAQMADTGWWINTSYGAPPEGRRGKYWKVPRP